MSPKSLMLWFSIVSVIGVLWGIIFAFFGLGVIPPFNTDVLMPWGNGVYGATLIGLSVTLFFVGRHAFRKNDTELMRVLLYGIGTWLLVEAAFSVYYEVYLNAGVDIGVGIILGFPLIKSIRSKPTT